ncbi:MAG TPA: cyclodeaminase/cyclohydrolase family protein [Trebonia sp.]
MNTETVEGWLDALASEAPTPGGGSAAAVNAAVAAALISMVCNLTVGKPRYAEHEQTMVAARSRADGLRKDALALADADARAFGAVTAAYRLPKATEEERRARTQAIQSALVGAADVPLRTAALAAAVIGLAAEILPGANVNVISDVAVAASSARAALDAAALNVEVNMAAMQDEAAREDLARQLERHAMAADQAGQVIATVRERIRQ